jgi:hypothetical protein
MRRKEEVQRLARMRAKLMAPTDPAAGELLNEINNLAQRIALHDPNVLEDDPDVSRRLTALTVRFEKWRQAQQLRITPVPPTRRKDAAK